MRFINITGEEIVYFKTDGTKEIFPSIGELKAEKVLCSKEEKDGFTICNYTYQSEVVSEEVQQTLIKHCTEENCYFIVSEIAYQKMLSMDLMPKNIVTIGETVKDDSGKVIGIKNFSRG